MYRLLLIYFTALSAACRCKWCDLTYPLFDRRATLFFSLSGHQRACFRPAFETSKHVSTRFLRTHDCCPQVVVAPQQAADHLRSTLEKARRSPPASTPYRGAQDLFGEDAIRVPTGKPCVYHRGAISPLEEVPVSTRTRTSLWPRLRMPSSGSYRHSRASKTETRSSSLCKSTRSPQAAGTGRRFRWY